MADIRNRIPNAMRIIKRDPKLSLLLQRATQMQRWQNKFDKAIDPPLRAYFRVQSYQGAVLTIQAASGVWAAHLRFQLPLLTKTLRKQETWKALQEVRVRVAPWIIMQDPKPKILPKAAKVAIEISAEGINQPKLKAALKKLASQCRHTDE